MQQTEASRFLERAADDPWSWATSNCLTLLGDWIDEKRGGGIGAAWRAKAMDEDAVRAAVNAAGGMLPFLEREALAAGLHRIDPAEAVDGDIGLVAVSTIVDEKIVSFEIGALRCAACWGARTLHGVMTVRCEALAAWRV